MTDGLKTVRAKIDSVRAHPANVRQGDVGAISESLRIHGQYRPIVVQKSTGHILAGNHTWRAAQTLGWTHIDTVTVDCDDDEALRILLVDNRSNDLATYDEHGLIGLLQQLIGSERELEGTGYTTDDLDQLLNDLDTLTLTPTNFEPVDEDNNPRLDQRDPHRCPECGFEWRVGPKGETVPV